MKHIFIYNPAAGKKNQTAMDDLRTHMARYDGKLEYEFYPTKAPGDATQYVKSCCESAPDVAMRFYACGGDGTANEVLHGIVGHDNVSMTCFPCGSGNDYVKYYGGADRFLNIDALLNATETPVDVMRIGDRYSMNVTNFGFDTAVLRTMIKVKRKKLIGGSNAYFTGIATALFTAMKNKCTVWVDGEKLNDGTCLLCTVANGKYVGGSFCCAPRSKNDDGLLEVCLVKPISRMTFVKLLGPYTHGQHLDDPALSKYIVYRRGRSVKVEAPEGFAYSLDGEVVENNDFTIEIMPQAIRFAVPADTAAPEATPAPESNCETDTESACDPTPAENTPETVAK